MRHHIYFISDLHLDQNLPVVTNLFENFIKNQAPQADALYILGDFFEAWIGDNDKSEFNEHIKYLLKKLSETVPIYFMVGNRDFLIGNKFCKEAGVEPLKDPYLTSIYNKQVLLSHGDFLCTEDWMHQIFRKATGTRFFKFLARIFPLSIKRKIADRMRKFSKKHHKSLSESAMDIVPNSLHKLLDQKPCDIMIHGHTHKPKVHKLTHNDKELHRVVLGAWHDHADILMIDETGHFELVQIN